MATGKIEDDIDPEQTFKVKVFYGILDIIILHLESRFTVTKKITSLFKVVNPLSLLELLRLTLKFKDSHL